MPASRRQTNDALAREAARLLATERASDIDEAVMLARGTFNAAGQPSRMQVRKHAQAISMQTMGEAAYRERARSLLAIAEETMTALEQAFPDAPTLLVGRAAEGHFDADPCVHIRMLTNVSTATIAASLDRLGYRDADFTFTTLATAHAGRLSQIEWIENDTRMVITRCTNAQAFESPNDLVTGRLLQTRTLHALRMLIDR